MSVERILEYRDLEKEKQPEKPKTIDKKLWPSQGVIEFRNVTYKYYETADPALKNLSFQIKSKEKVGIVGRTGAGKSSLIGEWHNSNYRYNSKMWQKNLNLTIGSLFRLAIVEGNILIDDIDTGDISLEDLRSSISIIPQDPVLFSGTLRRNLGLILIIHLNNRSLLRNL